MPKRRNRPAFGDLVETYEGLKAGKRMVVQGGLLVKGGLEKRMPLRAPALFDSL